MTAHEIYKALTPLDRALVLFFVQEYERRKAISEKLSQGQPWTHLLDLCSFYEKEIPRHLAHGKNRLGILIDFNLLVQHPHTHTLVPTDLAQEVSELIE